MFLLSSSIKRWWKNWKQWTSSQPSRKLEVLTWLIVCLVAGARIYDCSNYQPPVQERQVISYVFPDDYEVVKHERDSYRQLSEELQGTVEDLKNRGAKIVTVTQIKTVVQGGETIYIVLPREHVFKLDNGLPVARFEAGTEYKFETYNLSFQADIVVTENETGVKLVAKSSAGDDTYEIPVDSVVTFVEPPDAKPIFRPQIALLGGVSFPYTGPEVGVALPLLAGPKDNLSWLAPMVTISDEVKLGVAPVMFNVGKPIPLIDDLWIFPAYETNFVEHYGMVAVGTKL